MPISKKLAKILIIDDTKLMRSNIVSTLRQAGYHDIKEAKTVEQAELLLDNWHSNPTSSQKESSPILIGIEEEKQPEQQSDTWSGPDMVFLDIHLDVNVSETQKTGLLLLEKIRGHRSSSSTIPFIAIISADHSENTVSQAVQLQANAFLAKPFSSSNILQIMQLFQKTV